MICFDKVIAVLLGEMAGSGHQLVEHTRVGRCFVRRHRAGAGAVIESPRKEPASGRQVPLLRHQYVDDLAVLVDRSVQVDPAPGDFHIRFVGKPPITGNVSAGSGRVDQQRSEPLYPAVDGHMIDPHSALGQQLFDIAIGQSITEVPAHCQHDHLPRKPEAGERRRWREDRTNTAYAAHELEHARTTSSLCATVPALEVARRLGSGWMQANAERLLGRLALAAGEATQAERYVHDALGRLVAKGFALDIPECLDVLAAIAATQESFQEAARLLGAAAAGRQRLGIVRFPPEPEFWASVERTTREALGPDSYDPAFAAGAALGTDDTVAYVRRARGERKRPSRGWDSLTPTELQVVRHVTAGLTNRQIGERMFISPGTVKGHLAHIFTKLDTPSRSQLAAEATKRGLDPHAATDAPKR
jgi:DNA-binding CsgD family transcriptional regulator